MGLKVVSSMRAFALVVLGLTMSACSLAVPNDGEQGSTTIESPCPLPYPGDTSPVIGAFIERMRRAGYPAAVVDELDQRAHETAASPEVEQRRAEHAADWLVRTWLFAWMRALRPGVDIADREWISSNEIGFLPRNRLLTPGEVSLSGARAIAALAAHAPEKPADWEDAWDALVMTNHDAIHSDVPGVPAEWHGSDPVFRASGMAARLIAENAEAATFDEAVAATAEMSQKGLDLSVAEVDALIAIE
jgi:hypothetical protein